MNNFGTHHTNLSIRTIAAITFTAALVQLAHAGQSEQSGLPDAFKSSDLLWELKLGTHQYTIPVVDDGQLFIGVNDRGIKHPKCKSSGGGMLMRLDPATGKMAWQMVIPRWEEGNIRPMHFNLWKCGVCSQPEFDGKRVYIVGPRGDVLCLDRNGQADGNDGPFRKEAEYMEVPGYQLRKTDGDIIWEYNMVGGVDVCPHDVCGSSPVLVGDYLYTCTSNGQDTKHKYIVKPGAPALIVLDKKTGKLVAIEAEGISRNTLHCNWSSPIAATVGGKTMVLFGGGDGILYAFEPLARAASGVRRLKTVWKYDCNPKHYRFKPDGSKQQYSAHNKRVSTGPSEVIAIPTVAEGRIYLAIGQSPLHGKGQGMLNCVDARTGKKIWASPKVDRTTSEATVADGLVYIADLSGRLHCLDAATGEHYWQHDLEDKVWFASPTVIDGKVYISTERSKLWILKAGKRKQVITRSRYKSGAVTLVEDGGILYLPTQKRLMAVRLGGR